MYANRATLIGFLGKDAEVKTTKNQASLHCAVASDQAELEESRNRRTPERNDLASLHCVGQVGRVRGDSQQGRARTDPKARIRTREYTQKGTGKKAPDVKKSITEVRATSILRLDRAHVPGNSPPEGGTAQEGGPREATFSIEGVHRACGVCTPERDFVLPEEHTMTTEQAKQLSEDAIARLMQALEQGQSNALKNYLAVMSRFPSLLVGQLPFDLQPAASGDSHCGFSRMAQTPALRTQRRKGHRHSRPNGGQEEGRRGTQRRCAHPPLRGSVRRTYST